MLDAKRLVFLGTVAVVAACKKDPPPPLPRPITSALVGPGPFGAAPAKTESELLSEKLLSTTSFADALALVRPGMVDTVNVPSSGARLLFAWAAQHMTWPDVGVTKDETTFALVQKDSDSARGKRLCATGTVVQISKLKSALGDGFEGLLMSYGGNIFSFIAVGSTGTLVEQSQGRVCGVVIGKYDYSNSMGGESHAVALVGMFDLPENRATAQAARTGH